MSSSENTKRKQLDVFLELLLHSKGTEPVPDSTLPADVGLTCNSRQEG